MQVLGYRTSPSLIEHSIHAVVLLKTHIKLYPHQWLYIKINKWWKLQSASLYHHTYLVKSWWNSRLWHCDFSFLSLVLHSFRCLLSLKFLPPYTLWPPTMPSLMFPVPLPLKLLGSDPPPSFPVPINLDVISLFFFSLGVGTITITSRWRVKVFIVLLMQFWMTVSFGLHAGQNCMN